MTKPTLAVLVVLAVLIGCAMIISSQGTPRILPTIGNPPAISVSLTGVASSSTSSKGTPSTLPVLADRMPSFQGITKWWNTADGQPLTPEKLKGKVVLVDFWTYSCINCIRTYPFLKTMHARYADKGLVIVGVHTPEFAFEADAANVARELAKNGLNYPIALDANYSTWNAYQNQYWPAEYLFDRQGRLRRTHFGEGEYDQNEMAIRTLLDEAPVQLQPMGQAVSSSDLSMIHTPETYFGLARGSAFAGIPGIDGVDTTFDHTKASLESNKWQVVGTWKFSQEYVEASSANAVFEFNVQASKLHIVMASTDGKDKDLEVFVDGKKVKDVVVNSSTLYTLAEFANGGRHTVTVRIKQAGVRMYAATFS